MRQQRKVPFNIHPVDIVIFIIFALALVGFLLFFYRKPEYVEIKVKVTDQDVLYANTQPGNWYANRFEVGDAELDTLGRKISQITNVETYNVTSNNKVVYLTIKIRGLYDTRTKLYSAKGKQLIFGMPMRFNMSKVTFDGIITDFPGSGSYTSNITIGQITVTAILRGYNLGIEPTVIESINVGDTIKNSNGIILAEVKNTIVTPAERSVPDAYGNLHLTYDPIYKDAVITLAVRIIKFKGEEYAFDNVPVKIGEIIPLNFPQTSIFPVIIQVNTTI